MNASQQQLDPQTKTEAYKDIKVKVGEFVAAEYDY